MITQLAPLGATHSIVLILAYGEPKTSSALPPEGEARYGAEILQEVTVTAHLKPKDGVKGESRSLQFKGPVAEVERELAEKLPLVVTKVTEHLATLDQLDAELKAEQEAKKKENESKKATPGTPPAGVKSRTVYPATNKKPEVKPSKSPGMKKASAIIKGAAKSKPAAAATSGGAAAALAKLQQAATPAAEPAAQQSELPVSDTSASDALAELEKLAAGDAVEL